MWQKGCWNNKTIKSEANRMSIDGSMNVILKFKKNATG